MSIKRPSGLRGRKSGWNCDGGGRAHARTLFVLGYRCVGQSISFYKMERNGLPIIVPKEPWLTQTVIKKIQVRSGHNRSEYITAWNEKIESKPKLNCPPPSSAGSTSG